MLLRTFLDRLYAAAGVIAALCLIAILVVIVLQMGARWLLIPFPGSSEYAGYLMAASSFLAFAYALNSGAHIRVSLMLTALGERRWWGELWCFLIGTAITTWLAWFALRGTWMSWRWKELSQGLDATPMWIPQLSMSAGTVLLAIAF